MSPDMGLHPVLIINCIEECSEIKVYFPPHTMSVSKTIKLNAGKLNASEGKESRLYSQNIITLNVDFKYD